MEILLTLKGGRKIPIEVSQETIDRLEDNNQEIKLIVIASPVAREIELSQGEEANEVVYKLKVSSIEISQ